MGLLTKGGIGQVLKVDAETLTISSATASGRPYDMRGCDKACFVLGIGTAVAGLNATVAIQQSANEFGTTWAAITSATALIGSTNATILTYAKGILLTIGTDSTIGSTVVINGTTYTFATARAATSGQWGSTVDATAAGGLEQCSSSLAAAINAMNTNLTAATASTATLTVYANDGADTYITLNGVSSVVTGAYLQSEVMIEVSAAALNSTSRYIKIAASTCATAIRAAVTCIRVKDTAPSFTGARKSVLTT